MLGVPVALMIEHGAVSLSVAEHMALACLGRSTANLSLAMTGVAGPTGGSIDKPVGTVCFAVAQGDKGVISVQKLFAGNRQEIRQQAVLQALKILIEALEKIPRRNHEETTNHYSNAD
jgi:nicotinamide-nucleotide amidase